jgi:hypothetical protein
LPFFVNAAMQQLNTGMQQSNSCTLFVDAALQQLVSPALFVDAALNFVDSQIKCLLQPSVCLLQGLVVKLRH